jgi:hypothetical protein
MEIYQMLLVGIAGLIGLSMVWPNITTIHARMVKSTNTVPTPEEDFMRIIAGWNAFKGQCEEAGLDDVCEKLYDIFPMLIDADGADLPDQDQDKEVNDEEVNDE